MVALHIILIKECEGDSKKLKEGKKLMYNLSYMDNIAFTTNDNNDLLNLYSKTFAIFSKYKFELQKFATNNIECQKEIDTKFDSTEPNEIKLFGLGWDRQCDLFKTNKVQLNFEAKTKRSVLSSLHSNFDPLGFYIPILNRARQFLHSLQTNDKVSWDGILGDEKLNEWKKIVKQVNQNDLDFSVPRFLGNRDDKYDLVCYVDASKDFYGIIIYIKRSVDKNLKFVMARNKIVSKKLVSKSIPLLELTAIELGVDSLIELYQQFTKSIVPIKIGQLYLFSDSTISLSWIKAKVHDFTKIERKSIYLNNRLTNIVRSCETKTIQFRHIEGQNNPADGITRTLSPKLFAASRYFSGPKSPVIIENVDDSDLWAFPVPNPLAHHAPNVSLTTVNQQVANPLIDIEKMLSFSKTIKIMTIVFSFINKLKTRLYIKNSLKYAKFKDQNLNNACLAGNYLISLMHRKYYPNIFEFFEKQISP
jgi:hypothetical protein